MQFILVDLVLTLTESQPTHEVSIDVNFHRNITLVPGHSYEINCNHKIGGFGGQSNVWFHFNDTPVQDVTATPVNMSVVHAMEVDKNSWILVLQPFRETDSDDFLVTIIRQYSYIIIPTNLSKTKSGTKSLKKRDYWSKIGTFLRK